MTEAYVGIGSNIDPEKNIPAALRLLGKEVRLLAVSTFYKTEPLGSPGSRPFYNGAAKVDTDLEPRDLKFGVLRKIEEKLGRLRSRDKNAPRTIDLDLIIYGSLQIEEPDLVLPDPDILTRPFVAFGLLELAPGIVLPGSGLKLEDVVKSLSTESMTPLTGFTGKLKKEIKNEF